MKKKLIITFIICGFILASVFPTLAIISYFGKVEVDSENQSLIRLEDSTNYTKLSTDNTSRKINVDNLELVSEEIVDEEIPTTLEEVLTVVSIKGSEVKNNFKSHSKEIESGNLTFEIVTQDGENLFFKTYEELEFFVNDNDDYDKTFVLDKDNNLIRYTFLLVSKEEIEQGDEEDTGELSEENITSENNLENEEDVEKTN